MVAATSQVFINFVVLVLIHTPCMKGEEIYRQEIRQDGLLETSRGNLFRLFIMLCEKSEEQMSQVFYLLKISKWFSCMHTRHE